MSIILDHPDIPSPPAPDTQLWRYMSFTKLLSLVQSKTLYFSAVESFYADDPYEGRHTDPTILNFRASLEAAIISGVPEDARPRVLEQVEHVARLQLARRPHEYFINCWHENSTESAALWKLYGQIADGVAIRTTMGRLSNSLASDRIWAGRVRYENYTTFVSNPGNGFVPYYMKRHSFEHEREVRLVHWDYDRAQENRSGVSFPCDVAGLVEAVLVSPYVQTWVAETIKETLATVGLAAPVSQSSLLKIT